MKVVNKIFWDTDKISMITNHLDADTHSHLMLQLFVGVDDYVEIVIKDIRIKCNVIVVKMLHILFRQRGNCIFLRLLTQHLCMEKNLLIKWEKKIF